MTRDEVFEQYHPIRAAIQRILREAPEVCRAADLRRAISEIAPWAGEDQLQGELLDMMADVALFEPNTHGKRCFDRYLAKNGRRLPAGDRALAERMSHAWFSLFRVAERHEAAGLWLEDLLDGDRRVWLVDEGMEASASQNLIVGMRLFDAGPFHAGFGLITQPGDETLGPCLAAQARCVPLPVETSLAALVYGDHLAVETPIDADELEALESLAEAFMSNAAALIEHEPRPRKPRSKAPSSPARLAKPHSK